MTTASPGESPGPAAAPGHRIGLIGENGTGKTTLLRVLAGVDEPDAGTVVRPPALGSGRGGRAGRSVSPSGQPPLETFS
ncbi:ATP-binding cassette domain-containing protein [Micromonospora vulcania]|uniref:ATP-binding cassette domain-containing protein n=1 Tax=Micromonospora vulcania TaxID=1441873 RepID=A0ABW1H4X4_9ACTN